MGQGSEGVANDHVGEAPQGPEPDSCSEIPMAPANLRSPASDGRVIARGIKNAAAEGHIVVVLKAARPEHPRTADSGATRRVGPSVRGTRTAAQCAAVLGIPTKQAPVAEVRDLDEDEISAIL